MHICTDDARITQVRSKWMRAAQQIGVQAGGADHIVVVLDLDLFLAAFTYQHLGIVRAQSGPEQSCGAQLQLPAFLKALQQPIDFRCKPVACDFPIGTHVAQEAAAFGGWSGHTELDVSPGGAGAHKLR